MTREVLGLLSGGKAGKSERGGSLKEFDKRIGALGSRRAGGGESWAACVCVGVVF